MITFDDLRKRLQELQKQKIYIINIDIDSIDSPSVVRTIAKAIYLFGYDKIKAFISASRAGMQLLIETDGMNFLEALILYLMLDSDLYRTKMAAMRAVDMTRLNYFDVSFIKKHNYGQRYVGSLLEIDLREIFPPELLDKLENAKTLDEEEEVHKIFLNNIMKYLKVFYELYLVVPAKYLNDFINELVKVKVIRDPYHDDRVIIKYKSSSKEFINSLLEKFKDKIILYKIYKKNSKGDSIMA